MKSKLNIKSVLVIAILCVASLFFINKSLAANTAKVKVETANLRETAETTGKIVELISLNQEVEILEKSGEWYKVKYNGITGYLRQDLLTVNEENVETFNKIEENVTNIEINSDTNLNTDSNTENVVNENNEVITTENYTQDNSQTNSNKTTDIELGTYNIVSDSKLKLVPSINATNIIDVKKDEEVKVTEVINGWACIETNNTKGWIRQDKLQKPEEKTETDTTEELVEEVKTEAVIKTQFIGSETVNLRKEPQTSSEIVTTLPVNTAVEVYVEENGWSKVKVSGKEGYISTALLSDTKKETSRSLEMPRTTTTVTEKEEVSTNTPSSGNGSEVVALANQYMGCSYVLGGNGPSSFDCSGFTCYVLKKFGVSLNRTAAGQYSNGVAVSRSELQQGDLIMFGSSASNINHVGIYTGGGRIVHAANPSRGVTTDTINSGYYNTNYVGARRVI